MKVGIIFPHQLFDQNKVIEAVDKIYLVEEWLFFKQYAFHKQKIAFHRASMKVYEERLKNQGRIVNYIDSHDPNSDIRSLIEQLAEVDVKTIHCIDPTDNWLEKRLKETCLSHQMEIEFHPSPIFLNSKDELDYFVSKDRYSHKIFYKQQRVKRGLLLSDPKTPLGGKWSFDEENRKKYPRKQVPPPIQSYYSDEYWKEAVAYVNKFFSENPGFLPEFPIFPYTHSSVEKHLESFLQDHLSLFGTYEDAILKEKDTFLHHSILSPLINVGLLSPGDVIRKTVAFSQEHNIPINSLEGFIRQIIGWREFIRGVYESKGSAMRIKNYWNFKRKIPSSFYDGTTGILPIDTTIQKVLKHGYCHHIERLMVLGNFMLLCEFDPDEVYRWFMELFIDAYDWVMVPNVYGMSQFADGGTFATKPYISGTNYLMKMSDYPKGDWQPVWDGLFWNFMHRHQDFFRGNPRLNMLVNHLDRMDKQKLENHLVSANKFLENLNV